MALCDLQSRFQNNPLPSFTSEPQAEHPQSPPLNVYLFHALRPQKSFSDDGRSTVVDLPSPLERDDGRRFRIVGSCNGMVCLRLPRCRDLFLWNLSTGDYTKLPEPCRRPGCLYAPGFGYDSASDDYKLVLSTYYMESISAYGDGTATGYHWWHEIAVFSLKRNSCIIFDEYNNKATAHFWRYRDGYFPESTFLNGAIHWRSRIGDDNTLSAFDLEKETFFQVPIPPLPSSRISCSSPAMAMGVLGGCLPLMIDNSENSHPFELWVMKEYRVEASWTKVLRLLNPDDYVTGGMHEICSESLCISGDNAFIFIRNTRELMKFSERARRNT